MQYLVEEKYRLPQMNAVHVLPGIDEKEVRRRLLHDYNLEIGAGLGDLAGKIWRFGIMGYSCKMENVMLCLCALETVFADMGVDVHFGAAESAAYHAYAQNPTADAAGEEGGGLTAVAAATEVLSSDGAGPRPALFTLVRCSGQTEPLPDRAREPRLVERVEVQSRRTGAQQPVA